ncbi:MAG: PspC domain-containing protein [Rikenellaceae bacterium]
MKKVVKVSIGNLAFTIDEDGYELLKAYLGELNAHYKSKQNGDEIIEGIEERMAELFLEKSGKDAVVSMQVVKDVINILGRPEIIDEETGTSGFESSHEKGTRLTPKRIYRDPDNKVFGGVCSGLATYFNVDRVLVRIIFIICLIGFSALGFHFGGGSFMVLTYIILWIIIPEAKTVEQRCAMHGESPDLSHIQKRVEDGVNQVGSGLRRAGSQGGAIVNDIFRVIVKVIAVFLVLLSVSGILFLSFLLLGVEIFQGVIPFDVFDYVSLGFGNAIWLKISFLMVLFLPLVGMLYGGIQILFNFKSSKFRPGLIILILWIISGIAFATLSVKASRPYWSEGRDSSNLTLREDIDTLYLKFESPNPMPASRVFIDANRAEMILFWIDGQKENREIVTFPKVNIVRQGEGDTSIVYYDTHALAYSYAEAFIKAQNNLPDIELKDSLLTIHADIYNKLDKWSGLVKEVSIYLPERVKVIVQNPIKHDFDKDHKRNFDWSCHRNWHRDWYKERD